MMKKALVLVLSDAEVLELYHILVDRDGEAAIDFLNARLRQKVRQAMEGG